MKQILLALFAVLKVGSISAQVAIPNGGLETWSITFMAEPTNYFNANHKLYRWQAAKLKMSHYND